jgi:hypothetical protein
MDWDNLKELLMALFMAFLAWQNKRLGDKGKEIEQKIEHHEVKATARAAMRGEPTLPGGLGQQ